MKKSINSKWTVIAGAMALVFFLSQANHAGASGGQKVAQLQQKMADITLLKQQLHDHSEKAEQVLNALLSQKNELVTEIRILARSLNIKTLDKAQQHLRIHYNIELLRTLISYMNGFDEKIRFYRTGHDKLSYLLQLTGDDVKMAAALNDFEIDALTTQISLVINKYLPEAHAIQITPDRVAPISPEKVWDSVVQSKY